MKGCGELKEWIDPIVNHFWYYCQMAKGSVDELKELNGVIFLTFFLRNAYINIVCSTPLLQDANRSIVVMWRIFYVDGGVISCKHFRFVQTKCLTDYM